MTTDSGTNCLKAMLLVVFGILTFYMISTATGLFVIFFTTASNYDIDIYTGCLHGDTVVFNPYSYDKCIDVTTNKSYPVMKCSLRSDRSLWGECTQIGSIIWTLFMVLVMLGVMIYIFGKECQKCGCCKTEIATKEVVTKSEHTVSTDDIDIELDSTPYNQHQQQKKQRSHHTTTNDVMIDISLDKDKDNDPIGLESGSI